MCPLGTIEDNLNLVNGIINDTLKANQRPQNTTKLIAVSKTKPRGLIEQALKAGQRLFGENRVQESEEKWIDLKKKYPDTELHLIGPLQTNKALIAVNLFEYSANTLFFSRCFSAGSTKDDERPLSGISG